MLICEERRVREETQNQLLLRGLIRSYFLSINARFEALLLIYIVQLQIVNSNNIELSPPYVD